MAEFVPCGRFQLIRRLATGGMADIFLATAPSPAGRPELFVVKRVLPHLAEDPAFIQMFLDEARVMSLLRHPGIVRTVEFGRTDDKPFYAMEHLVGEDVRTVRMAASKEHVPIPPAVAATIIARAAEALHHAHTLVGESGHPLHVVHRDISPSNLFVTYAGTVKVLDFGLARWKERLHRTDAGHRRGKPSYMAPEQLQSGHVDLRADIFSLGLCLDELLMGRRLLRDRDVRAGATDETPSGIVPIARSRRDVPEAVYAIIEKAIALLPEDRYPTADAFRADLDAWLATLPASGPGVVAALLSELFGEEHIRKKSQGAPERASTATATGQLPQASPGTSEPASTGRKGGLVVAGLAAVLLVIAGSVFLSPLRRPSALNVAPVAASPPSPPEPVGLGWLTVTGSVAADAWVDGKSVGTLPVRHLKLAAGSHRVRMRNGPLGLERQISTFVSPDRETLESESFQKGTLEINAAPGVEVWLDGVKKGTAPLAPLDAWEGRHSVLFQTAGAREQIAVEVTPGATTRVKPASHL